MPTRQAQFAQQKEAKRLVGELLQSVERLRYLTTVRGISKHTIKREIDTVVSLAYRLSINQSTAQNSPREPSEPNHD